MATAKSKPAAKMKPNQRRVTYPVVTSKAVSPEVYLEQVLRGYDGYRVNAEPTQFTLGSVIKLYKREEGPDSDSAFFAVVVAVDLTQISYAYLSKGSVFEESMSFVADDYVIETIYVPGHIPMVKK